MSALTEVIRTALRNRQRHTHVYPTPDDFYAIVADAECRDNSSIFTSEELSCKIRISACSQAIKTWEKSVLASGYSR